MSFFARRNGAADHDFAQAEPEIVAPPVAPGGAVGMAPPPAMADAMLRKFTGMSFSDVQGAAQEAGEMLSGYKASLDRIEGHLVAINDAIGALAVRLAALESRKR